MLRTWLGNLEVQELLACNLLIWTWNKFCEFQDGDGGEKWGGGGRGVGNDKQLPSFGLAFGSHHQEFSFFLHLTHH